MKKQYQKPLIAIEHYELTQSIASCSIKIGFLDRMCVLRDTDATAEMRNLAMEFYFSTGCSKTIEMGETREDGICYHTNMNAAFSS